MFSSGNRVVLCLTTTVDLVRKMRQGGVPFYDLFADIPLGTVVALAGAARPVFIICLPGFRNLPDFKTVGAVMMAALEEKMAVLIGKTVIFAILGRFCQKFRKGMEQNMSAMLPIPAFHGSG